MYGTSREGKKRAEVPRRRGLDIAVPIVFTGVAEGQGYTQNPPSRSSNCARGVVRDCGPIQYEPQSVEGPKGFPSGGPADGKLCAAGLSQFAQLDDPRGGTWPAKGPDERRELHLHVDADRRPRHDGRFATSSPRTDDGIPARHSPGHNSKRHPSSRCPSTARGRPRRFRIRANCRRANPAGT
jgi:hypothetical protein